MIMRPKSLAILGAGAAIAVAAAVIAGSTNAEIRTRVGVVPARAASNMPPSASITIRSLDDAIGFLNARDPEFQAGAGLTNFARGLSAYKTPLANGGFCISFANATSCTKQPPTHTEPVIGLGIDIDAERSGEPFVLIGIKAPDVVSVTYTCAGQTYPATLDGDVVAFVAPSATLRADDCVANAAFRSGDVVSVRV
jgi:hypothetical protein